jgi:hypothetical protein
MWTGALALALPGLLAVACSLGEGTTADCDPDAPPGSDRACLSLHPCDEGRGGIAAGNEACCLRFANYRYQRCLASLANEPQFIDEPDDFRTLCVGDGPCCESSSRDFESCMAEGLTSSGTSAGGTGGTAGGGGASGGMGGT